MRAATLFAAIAASVALVLALVALVTGAEDEDEEHRTIELVPIGDPLTGSTADLGGYFAQGVHPSDALRQFSEEVQQDGEPVGRTFGTCTFAGRGREGRGLCNITIELEEGKITAGGTIKFGEEGSPQELSIVGGTGEFENAGGTVALQPGEATKNSPLVTGQPVPGASLTINVTEDGG